MVDAVFREKTEAGLFAICAAFLSVSLVGFELQDNSNFDIVKSLVNNSLARQKSLLRSTRTGQWRFVDYFHLASQRLEWCYHLRPDQGTCSVLKSYPRKRHSISDPLYQSRGPQSSLWYGSLLCSVYLQENLLPKLRFLEVSEANDLLPPWCRPQITTTHRSWRLLVVDERRLWTFGWSRWWASPSSCHSVSSRVIHCARQSPRTISWLRSRLCAGNGKESDLQHMALGKKWKRRPKLTWKQRN
jgi:hypothetical protein